LNPLRQSLIRADQDAVSAHTTSCSSSRPFRPRFGRNVADAVADADHIGLKRAINYHDPGVAREVGKTELPARLDSPG